MKVPCCIDCAHLKDIRKGGPNRLDTGVCSIYGSRKVTHHPACNKNFRKKEEEYGNES